MKKTANLGLNLIEEHDPVEIAVMNENMITLDRETGGMHGQIFYNSFAQIGRAYTETTPLGEVFAAMADHSVLTVEITTAQTQYENLTGVLTLKRVSENMGSGSLMAGGNLYSLQITKNSNGGYEVKLTRQVSTKQLCNHNELINADFRQGRLVNQRGQTVYNNCGYFIDRWVMGDGVTCTLEEDGLRISNNSDYYNGIWYLTEKPLQAEKNYTISLNILGNTNVFTLFVQHYGGEYYNDVREDVTGTGIYSKSFTHATSPYITKIAISLAPQSEIKLQAAMLEYGDTSTLHNWHGDYATELLKCQRYLYRIDLKDYIRWAWGQVIDGGNRVVQILAQIPTMRISPTIIQNGLVAGQASTGEAAFITNLTVVGKNDGGICMNGILDNGTLPHGSVVGVYAYDGHILLSAEL